MFADIVATSNNLFLLTFLESISNFLFTSFDLDSMCFTTSMVLLLCFSINSVPLFIKHSVKTIAVVVPSPAVFAVLLAASFIICIERFSIGLSKNTLLATVTPSFVIVIPPTCSGDSIKTVLPRGPNVLLTAFEIFVIPEISLFRASESNDKSLGM